MRFLALILVCASAAPSTAGAAQAQPAAPPIPCTHDWSKAPIARVTIASLPGYAAYLNLGGTRWRRDQEPILGDLARIGRCKDATAIDWDTHMIKDGLREIEALNEHAQSFPEDAADLRRLVAMIRDAIKWAEDERTNIRNEQARRNAVSSRNTGVAPTEPNRNRPFAPGRASAAARDMKPLVLAKNASEGKQMVDRLMTRVPNREFAEWAGREVKVIRVSRDRGAEDRAMGIMQETPGRPVLALYDPFFARDEEDQLNLLTFEMAKGLWFSEINSGPRELVTSQERTVRALLDQHQAVIDVMRFRLKDSEGMGGLWDNDPQSQFAYAARVAMLNLAPPSANPDPVLYSPEQWARLVRQWPQARSDFAKVLNNLVKK